jgi:hypothetical protein
MTNGSPTVSTVFCEDILKDLVSDYEQKAIHPDMKMVAKRLLNRSPEMVGVYNEVCSKLKNCYQETHDILKLVLAKAAQYEGGAVRNARDDQKRLKENYEKVAHLALELADLLDERRELYESTEFSRTTHRDIVKVIDLAARNNSYYSSWVKEPLLALRARFDWRFWPELSEVMREIASDSFHAEVRTDDPIVAAILTSNRKSKTDFLRALLHGIAEFKEDNRGSLASNFRLSDKSLASIMNCALDLDSEDLEDAQSVKRARQRIRKK